MPERRAGGRPMVKMRRAIIDGPPKTLRDRVVKAHM